MKSSSSEESVRKRSHSVGANSLAPSVLSAMTATNICDINDVIMDAKEDVIGELKIACELFSLTDDDDSLHLLDGSKSQKYVFHDDPHSFETSIDYLVVTSNNNSLTMSEIAADLDNSTTTPEIQDVNSAEHIYSNSHFKFEVLETTV